jgi:drug/metabolite transporter (DMT)-like permease
MTLSVLLRDLPWYILFSIAGTTAAAFAKAALARAHTRDWGGAAWRFSAGSAAMAVNLALLFYLLGRTDMVVMVPMSVGFNLLTASVIAVVFFRERIGGWKAAGMVLIAAGVLCIGWGG